MKKHYTVRKIIICDLKGAACGELYPYNSSIKPKCFGCDYYENIHRPGTMPNYSFEEI